MGELRVRVVDKKGRAEGGGGGAKLASPALLTGVFITPSPLCPPPPPPQPTPTQLPTPCGLTALVHSLVVMKMSERAMPQSARARPCDKVGRGVVWVGGWGWGGRVGRSGDDVAAGRAGVVGWGGQRPQLPCCHAPTHHALLVPVGLGCVHVPAVPQRQQGK